MKTMALFGTSADPPTAAHQDILAWLSQHYDQVAVWASNNPFKEHQASLEHRQGMLSVMCEKLEVAENNVQVFEELSYSRSLDTVQKAKEIWGEAVEYSLVVGSDLVPQIPRWYKVKDLLDQVKLLIISRPGYSLKEEELEALQRLGAEYAIATLDVPPVSSTEYRQRKTSNVLTQEVKDYIHREQLYVCQ